MRDRNWPPYLRFHRWHRRINLRAAHENRVRRMLKPSLPSLTPARLPVLWPMMRIRTQPFFLEATLTMTALFATTPGFSPGRASGPSSLEKLPHPRVRKLNGSSAGAVRNQRSVGFQLTKCCAPRGIRRYRELFAMLEVESIGVLARFDFQCLVAAFNPGNSPHGVRQCRQWRELTRGGVPPTGPHG